MDESIWLQYFLRRREEFYNPETVRRLLSLLAGDSFRLIADANEPAYEVWLDVSLDKSPDEATLQKEDASITTVFTAGISSALLLKVERYIHKQDPLLSFHAYSVTREGPLARVEFGGSIEPEEGYILLSIATETFAFEWADEEARAKGEAREEFWLGLLQEVYRCWHPLYAHEFDHSATVLQPKQEDIRALNTPAIYEYNFFGPEFVAKLGRERLLAAPAWKVEVLDDGGIYLYCPLPEYRRDTAAHMNLLAANVDTPEVLDE